MRHGFYGASLAVLGFVAVLSAAAAAQKDAKEDKKPKAAERVECVLLDMGESYKLAAKNGALFVSCFVPNTSALSAGPGEKQQELILVPKKPGIYQITLTSVDPGGGPKVTETLTVVIKPLAK